VSLVEPTWWERYWARRRAGSRAREKYHQMRKHWLHRKRKVWWALAGGLLVLWLAFHVILSATAPADSRVAGVWMWSSGFIAGTAVMTFIAVRMSPPGSVERWQEGAYGEAATAKELEKLPRGWEAMHDLRNGDYNFDHVVVGPPGVFLLNSKWSSFRLEPSVDGGLIGVQVDDETVTMRIEPHVRQATRDALDLKKVIEARTGKRLWVQSVIVWWGAYPGGGQSVAKVAVVSGDVLVQRLLSQSGRHPTDVAAIADALRPGRHAAAR